MRIVDLHCDLLLYLATNKKRSANNPESLCSVPLLKEGKVCLQTLAIFSETKVGSVSFAEKQRQLFIQLCHRHSKQKKIHFIPAIENASGLLEETEPFEQATLRLEKWIQETGPFLYLSLTWNSENRFGGGNETTIGLKKDGEHLLDFLSEKNTAIDFSHTSEALAHDILNYIDKKGLKLTPIASHSNFRQINDHPRNLTDEIAKEIIHRQGIIGINFIRGFIGESSADISRHIQHGLTLGAENTLAFGADFFAECDMGTELDYLKPFFYSEFNNSSCYPKLLRNLSQNFSADFLKKLAHENAFSFLKTQLS